MIVRASPAFNGGDEAGDRALRCIGGLSTTLSRHKQPKTYWVQVEGAPDAAQLSALRAGVVLNDGLTRPAEVRLLETAPALWERHPPVRYRKTVPDAWLEVVITEGRNRQVRRMTAAVGLPTLRLVRTAIGGNRLAGLAPGEWREVQA